MSFNRESFLKEVQVERAKEDKSCEYEVTLKAISVYNQYYDCFSDKLKRNDKFRIEYDNHSYFSFSADILTSIRTPFNTSLLLAGNTPIYEKGDYIRSYILEGHNDKYEKSIRPYCKAFAFVYYWIGNMMPVIYSFQGGSADTWKRKMELMKKWYNTDLENNPISDEELRRRIVDELSKGKSGHRDPKYKLWIQWMKRTCCINGFEDFVKCFFLIDMVEYTNYPFKVENIKDIIKNADWHYDYLPKKVDTRILKEFWINNTKLIIQRSYRILYKKMNELDKTDQDNIKELFKYVFGTVAELHEFDEELF